MAKVIITLDDSDNDGGVSIDVNFVGGAHGDAVPTCAQTLALDFLKLCGSHEVINGPIITGV